MRQFCLTACLAFLLGVVGQPAHAALVLNNLAIGSLGTYDVAFVGSSAGVAANGPNAPFTTQVNATTAVDAIITALQGLGNPGLGTSTSPANQFLLLFEIAPNCCGGSYNTIVGEQDSSGIWGRRANVLSGGANLGGTYVRLTEVTAVPLPGAVLLFGTALVGLRLARRRKVT